MWSGFIDSDEYLIRFNSPRMSMAAGGARDFYWASFARGTAMSTRLLFESMRMLGFPLYAEVGYPEGGLPQNWHEAKMSHYQPFRAFLFVRDAFADETVAKLEQRKIG